MSIEFLIDDNLKAKKNANKKLRKVVREVTKKPKEADYNASNVIFLRKFVLAMRYAGKEMPQVDRKNSEDYIEKVPVPLRFNINNTTKPRLNDNLQADNIVLEHKKPFKLQINKDVLSSALSS